MLQSSKPQRFEDLIRFILLSGIAEMPVQAAGPAPGTYITTVQSCLSMSLLQKFWLFIVCLSFKLNCSEHCQVCRIFIIPVSTEIFPRTGITESKV